MSIGPMTHDSFLHHSRMAPTQAQRVLEQLVQQGAVTRTIVA
ncbi:hypothetical protein [Ramlibacter ginsenosidimutans]|nr:hypothetical protein [Ramlibacter ginsenosidimutans]